MALALSVLAGGFGCLVMAGWILDIGMFKTVVSGFADMKANTALALMVTGFAGALLAASRDSRASRLAIRAAATIAIVAGVLDMGGEPPP